jgi:hypothetical protein
MFRVKVICMFRIYSLCIHPYKIRNHCVQLSSMAKPAFSLSLISKCNLVRPYYWSLDFNKMSNLTLSLTDSYI